MAILKQTPLKAPYTLNATAATTTVITTTAGALVGDLVIVSWVCAPGSTADSLTVTDANSNTWELSSSFMASNIQLLQAHSFLTTAIDSGDTITVGHGSRSKRCAYVDNFRGALSRRANSSAGDSATGSDPSGTIGRLPGDLVYVTEANVFSAGTPTWSGNYWDPQTVSSTVGTGDKTLNVGWHIASSGTTESPSINNSVGGAWMMVLSSFEPDTTTVADVNETFQYVGGIWV